MKKLCSMGYGILPVVCDVFAATICAVLVLISSHLKVPFYPVPFTMQTFAVIAVSLFAGKRRAFLGILMFIGMWRPTNPLTLGYILGFLIVPFIAGKGAPNQGIGNLVCKIFLSNLIILTTGTLFLSFFIGLKMAFISGFLFFVPADILKGMLALAMVCAWEKMLSFDEER